MCFAERLKKMRTDLNLSQVAFSKKINVGISTVAAWETGTRKIKDIHVAQICQVFGVDEDWLRGNKVDNNMYRTLNTDNGLAIEIAKLLSTDDDWTKNTVLQFLKLPKEQREVIKTFLLAITPIKRDCIRKCVNGNNNFIEEKGDSPP